MIKVAMFGSRHLPARGYRRISETVNFLTRNSDDVCILSGGAHGADSAVRRAALKHSNGRPDPCMYEEYPADWKKYGKYAGFKRNIEMTEASQFGIAFWENRGEPSPGTTHSVECLKKQGKHWGEHDTATGDWYWDGLAFTDTQFHYILYRQVAPEQFCNAERHVSPHRGCILR